MKKQGIVPDPPSNVSDLVVEQVVKGRSGRLVVPKSEEGKMGLREWPMWVQDVLYGFVSQKKKKNGLNLGGDEDSKLV